MFFRGPTGGEKTLLCGYPKLNITYILETLEGPNLEFVFELDGWGLLGSVGEWCFG